MARTRRFPENICAKRPRVRIGLKVPAQVGKHSPGSVTLLPLDVVPEVFRRLRSVPHEDRAQVSGCLAHGPVAQQFRRRLHRRGHCDVHEHGAGRRRGIHPPPPVLATTSSAPSITSSDPKNVTSRTSHYGIDTNASSTPTGQATISHSGAFGRGAATNLTMVPDLNLGIVVLTNATPTGVPQAIATQLVVTWSNSAPRRGPGLT